MKTPLQHFSTRRLGAWQGEWEFLQRSLSREPDAVQAWWWKIRLRVLAFVIARYGADPAVRARDHVAEPRAQESDLTFGERRTVEPRPRAALGAHLQSIAEANDFPRPAAPLDAGHDQFWQKRVEDRTAFIVAVVMILCTLLIIGAAIATGEHTFLRVFAFMLGGITLWVALRLLLRLIGRWLKRE